MTATISFNYVPLTFISTREEIARQATNTAIFHSVLQEFNETRELGELLDSTQYGYTASAQEAGINKFLRITDINDGSVDWNTVPFCDCDRAEKYELQPNDILIARTGNNISYLVESNVPENTVFASYLIRLVCNQELLLPEYLYQFLNSYSFWPQILKKQHGALLQNVNATRMRELLIPYCSIDKQKEYLAGVNSTTTLKQKGVKKKVFTQFSLKTELTHQVYLLKKLRQRILEEAIEGKLTANWRAENPDVEPASKLLNRIQAEKAQMIKEGKLKKQKALPPFSADTIPFELPLGWEWVRLDEITLINGGKRVSNGYTLLRKETPYVYIRVSDMKDMTISDDDLHYIDAEMHEKIERYIITQDDLYIVIVGATIGKCGLVPPKFDGMNLTENAARIVLIKIDKLFLLWLLNSDFCQLQFIDRTKRVGVQKMALIRLKTTVLPIPPLAEQKAIVAKVETLLHLCDQLETEINTNQKNAASLLQAVLREAFSQNQNDLL